MLTNKLWKLLDILEITTRHFKKNDIENPRLNAECLLADALNLDRIQLYLQYERLLSKEELEKYRELVRRRSRHEPLQYITGKTEFMGLPFQLTTDVLIPRPETESVVEHAVAKLKELNIQSPLIWDIGTGSGCIAISMAHYFPDSLIMASDISDAILAVAQQNARINLVQDRIEFFNHNILTDTLPENRTINMIISNPPYITESEWHTLPREVRDFEPEFALTDHLNGLTFYKRICDLASHLNPDIIILELSGTQFDNIIKLTKNANFKDIDILNDMNAIPRILDITV